MILFLFIYLFIFKFTLWFLFLRLTFRPLFCKSNNTFVSLVLQYYLLSDFETRINFPLVHYDFFSLHLYEDSFQSDPILN